MIYFAMYVCLMVAIYCFTYDDTPCERMELGYNCKGKDCECRKEQRP